MESVQNALIRDIGSKVSAIEDLIGKRTAPEVIRVHGSVKSPLQTRRPWSPFFGHCPAASSTVEKHSSILETFASVLAQYVTRSSSRDTSLESWITDRRSG